MRQTYTEDAKSSNSRYMRSHRKVYSTKKVGNFKNRVATPTFYVAKWKRQAYSTSD